MRFAAIIRAAIVANGAIIIVGFCLKLLSAAMLYISREAVEQLKASAGSSRVRPTEFQRISWNARPTIKTRCVRLSFRPPYRPVTIHFLTDGSLFYLLAFLLPFYILYFPFIANRRRLTLYIVMDDDLSTLR